MLEDSRKLIRSGRFSGMCVGYQALFEKRATHSHSCAAAPGDLQGRVVRFNEEPGLKKIRKSAEPRFELRNPVAVFRDIPAAVTFISSNAFPTNRSIPPSSPAHGYGQPSPPPRLA